MDRPDELDTLAAEWIALWESELAALAADRETTEAWAAGMALLAASWHAQAAGTAAMAAARARPDAGHRESGPCALQAGAAPARPPPAARDGAGDGGDADALRGRVAELERRLAAIEGGAGGGRADRAPPRGERRRG